jgi:hypothetical protein
MPMGISFTLDLTLITPKGIKVGANFRPVPVVLLKLAKESGRNHDIHQRY